MKAKDVIKVALRYCSVTTSYLEEPQDAYDICIPKLNQLLDIYRNQNLLVNSDQAEITTPNQDLSFPAYAYPAIESNLAKMVWHLFNMGQEMPMWLIQLASETENDMFTFGGAPVNSVFPENLPKGQGQWWMYNWNYYPQCDPPVYDCGDDKVLSETGTPIVTEKTRNDT